MSIFHQTNPAITSNEAVRTHIQDLPAGAAFTPKSLLHLGPRTAIDQVLTRLTRNGAISRMARGVYAKPGQGEFGPTLPSVLEVVQARAESQGVTLATHGAVALNHFGLSTQNPMRLVLYTTGRSRETKVIANFTLVENLRFSTRGEQSE
jgi:predicted transcriptional regulator of viral defense system